MKVESLVSDERGLYEGLGTNFGLVVNVVVQDFLDGDCAHNKVLISFASHVLQADLVLVVKKDVTRGLAEHSPLCIVW